MSEIDRLIADCVYVITTTYEEFKVLQAKYLHFPLPFLHVYALDSLLDLQPAPKYVVNEFRLGDVELAHERLWVDGTMTYEEAGKKITDIMTALSARGTLIFSDMEGLAYYIDKEGS